MHYHKIDVFIDKCTKNHLKIRSFDWLKKMWKFCKKNMKKWKSLKKNGLERDWTHDHWVATWQKILRASKLPLGQTRFGVSGSETRVDKILGHLNLKKFKNTRASMFFMFDLQIPQIMLKSLFLNAIGRSKNKTCSVFHHEHEGGC